MKFTGTDNYVATDDLRMAVDAAVALQRPLLIKGEPGTGKTMLAEEVASGLGMKLIQWHIKSTTKAQQGLYEYDAVSRLRDSQLGDEAPAPCDPRLCPTCAPRPIQCRHQYTVALASAPLRGGREARRPRRSRAPQMRQQQQGGS